MTKREKMALEHLPALQRNAVKVLMKRGWSFKAIVNSMGEEKIVELIRSHPLKPMTQLKDVFYDGKASRAVSI